MEFLLGFIAGTVSLSLALYIAFLLFENKED
jgi:hypothetical protein